MNRAIFAVSSTCLALLLGSVGLAADIYKCVDQDGNPSYSQTPCPKQASVGVDPQSSSVSVDAIDCEHANRFAFSAARLKQAGTRSDELFDRYGGRDSLSQGSINIIKHVYGYRSSDGTSAETIAAQAEKKCKSSLLGDVSCERLPRSYTESIGGCNPGDIDIDSSLLQVESFAPDPAAGQAAVDETDEQCRKRYRDAIDAVEAEMFQDYSPEQAAAYRQRLLALTQRLRQC